MKITKLAFETKCGFIEYFHFFTKGFKKKYIKNFFKVGAKIAIFAVIWSKLKKKFISPKSSVICGLCRNFTFKIDLHPPGTSKPSKRQSC